MPETLVHPLELSDRELDLVAAGQGVNVGGIQVNVNDVLSHNDVDVRVPVDIRDVNVGVAAAVALLGGAGAVVGQV
jgi:hypothetical protein